VRGSIQQQNHWGHRLAYWIATGFGVGRIPIAPGTFGTLLAIPLYLALRGLAPLFYLLAVAVLFAVGVWICHVAERTLGADHGGIVWDEVVGYLVAMYLAPTGWYWVVIGFVLFRVFDIWKPFPIRRFERTLRGGFGVMADDVVAGVYACVMLQLMAHILTREMT
jgi:phosphatidylglycerophosphatase A